MPTLQQFRLLYLEKVDAFDRRDWDAVLDGFPGRFEWHFPGSFVVRVLARGAGAASGVSIEFELAQLWQFDGDEPVRTREFSDFSEALAKARQ